jgi:hypothetical protein
MITRSSLLYRVILQSDHQCLEGTYCAPGTWDRHREDRNCSLLDGEIKDIHKDRMRARHGGAPCNPSYSGD